MKPETRNILVCSRMNKNLSPEKRKQFAEFMKHVRKLHPRKGKHAMKTKKITNKQRNELNMQQVKNGERFIKLSKMNGAGTMYAEITKVFKNSVHLNGFVFWNSKPEKVSAWNLTQEIPFVTFVSQAEFEAIKAKCPKPFFNVSNENSNLFSGTFQEIINRYGTELLQEEIEALQQMKVNEKLTIEELVLKRIY